MCPAFLWGLISLTGSASLPYVLQTLAVTVRPYSSLSLYPEHSIFVLFWTVLPGYVFSATVRILGAWW